MTIYLNFLKKRLDMEQTNGRHQRHHGSVDRVGDLNAEDLGSNP